MSEILILDDDRKIRELLALWLKAAGYTINEAADAQSAVAVLATKPIGVALLDKDMPGEHNGLWVVEQIQDGHPAVAMLLATGDDQIAPRVSLSRGIQGYLVKPFKREMVLQAVKDAMAWHTVAAKQPPKKRDDGDLEEWLNRAGRPPKNH